MEIASIFITGGTGYLGKPLIRELSKRGHTVLALVRQSSTHKLPPGCSAVVGDALQASTFQKSVRQGCIFVQLVGTPSPSPGKEREFLDIDLVSARESVMAANVAAVKHFVYVSVAQPAPVMKAYVEVRKQAEAILLSSGIDNTILRPWYVLGPGHRWPYALIPFYWLLEHIPSTRDSARRLGLVSRDQMTRALIYAIENPASGSRIITVEEIRRC